MKKFVLVIFFSLLVSFAYAQDKGMGIGVVLGKPVGITFKYWTGNETALNFELGYSVAASKVKLHLNGDYLWHNENLIKSKERIPLFYGVGGRLKIDADDKASLGVRGVVGLVWFPRSSKFDIFLELAPVIKIFPSTSLDADAAIGFRYFF